MQEELLKQRIKYLIEHGGLYPKQGRDWLPFLVTAAVIIGALVVLH